MSAQSPRRATTTYEHCVAFSRKVAQTNHCSIMASRIDCCNSLSPWLQSTSCSGFNTFCLSFGLSSLNCRLCCISFPCMNVSSSKWQLFSDPTGLSPFFSSSVYVSVQSRFCQLIGHSYVMDTKCFMWLHQPFISATAYWLLRYVWKLFYSTMLLDSST